MKPIGQTFFVDEPAVGVPGVFITKVDIYFKSVSSTQGIELQIRTTLNGIPTQERLPFASKILEPSGSPKPVASNDGSLATTFEFDTPVFVQSGLSYALVLIPLGGNPDYQVWTAEIGQNDATTNAPIYTNNETGDLFISSNDRSWTPIITEDMKFTIYRADFTSSSGSAVFRNGNTDFIEIKDIINFRNFDIVYPSNGYLDIAVLTVASNTGFANGNFVHQSNGSANVATGYIYGTTATTLKLANVSGIFSASYQIRSSNSSTNTTVSVVSQNASIISGSNSFTVPDSSVFSVNDVIHISTNNGANTIIVKVTALPDTTTVRFANLIYESKAVSDFTDQNSLYGKIMYNGTLTGQIRSLSPSVDQQSRTICVLSNVTSDTSNNFYSATGKKLFSLGEGGSASLVKIKNFVYSQLSPQIGNISPPNTSINFSFKGFRKNTTFDRDSSYINLSDGISNEMNDYERLILSRSKEVVGGGTILPVDRVNQRSVLIKADMSSSNNKISPSLDTISKLTHFTKNKLVEDFILFGYYIDVANVSNTFVSGDTVQQGDTTAVVRFANSSFMRLTDVSNGSISANSTTIVKVGATTTNALITYAEHFNECLDNGPSIVSRYISKKIILASGQESEDILAFLAAYRPLGSNLRVYAKIINNQDSESYSDKHWTYLPEVSGTFSSQVNKNDIVEISYGFTKSINLVANGAVAPNSSLTFNLTANTSGANATTDTITLASANTYLSVNDPVYYKVPTSNTAIEGLTGNSYYYVSFVNSSAFALSETSGGSNINITEARTTNPGETHTLTPTTDVVTLPSPYTTEGLIKNTLIYVEDIATKSFNVRVIKEIANSSSVIVNKKLSFVTSNASIGTIPNMLSPYTAFLYDGNSNIVRYVTPNDLYFDTYSQFSIKIIPVSISSHIVPRAADMRVLAIQA